MTMYVNKTNLDIVSIVWLARSKGVRIPYYRSVDAALIAQLDTEEVLDVKDNDIGTHKCELRDGSYYHVYRAYTAEELVSQEQSWVSQELVNADVEVRKHDDTHGRVVGTRPQWRTYRNALRDHIINDVIMGTRPVRPV